MAGLILLLAVVPPARGQGEEMGWAVRVENEVFRDDGVGGLVPLEEAQTVRYGWRLVSGPRSLAVIQLFPRGILGLCAESDLTLDRRRMPALTEACPKLAVKVRACLRVSGVLAYGGCRLTVETPDALILAQATDFAVLVHPVYGTRVLVFEGRVEVEGLDGRALGALETGQQGRVAAGGILEPGPLPPPGAAPGPLQELPFPDPPLLPREPGLDVVDPFARFEPPLDPLP